MQLSDLQNNMVVTYRLGRAGRIKYHWKEWKQGSIYVSRRETPLPKKIRRQHGIIGEVGELLILTTNDDVTAEYGFRDYTGNGIFMCEDWLLQIEGLE